MGTCWTFRAGKSCSGCSYGHICYNCGAKHPASNCTSSGNQQRNRTSKQGPFGLLNSAEPDKVIEYSDDEEEAKAKANRRKERMAKNGSSDNASSLKVDETGTPLQQGTKKGSRKGSWQNQAKAHPVDQKQNAAVTQRGPPPRPGFSLQHPMPQGFPEPSLQGQNYIRMHPPPLGPHNL
ncbi:uncharacterized protein LOC122950071 [Acropora millepora]|uniref:uncharacterized protein LOC122950071 n=1 Tax=Acropora millepora TaxID=45264 RepID=UPI001CF5991D|nr:uncharacterized protein LOC122950071 [Acropora millepora]